MFEHASTDALLSTIGDTYRDESRLVARRLAAVAELLARRTAEAEIEDPDCGYMIVTGLQRTSAEVAAVMNLSPMAAGNAVSHAEALHDRLPKIAAVLAEGRIDWRTVQLILTRSGLVRDRTALAALDSRLAQRIPHWQSWSRKRVADAVDTAVRTLDPDAVRERKRAEESRHLDVVPTGNGTAKVDGIVTASTAVIFDQKLTDLATAVCRDDPRTIAQRRADALDAMAQGQLLACRCDACAATDAAAVPDRGGFRPVINVIADESTVLREGRRPGHLDGFGVIDADMVRELSQGATVRPLDVPIVSGEEALRYQPTAAVERFVRLRDLTCRFPGCDRRAERCDIDHTVPFNHRDPAAGGKTVPENLKCLCRQHHRLKTFHDGWRDVQLPDGTIVWTSPTGRVFRTTPGGAELFRRPGPPACTPLKPRRRNPSREKKARLARRRARNARLRPVNAAHAAQRRLERARREEIEYRRDRNRHRTMLVMFKGVRTSKSPFMRWVNEPYESLELPPDWRPPEQPPLPDDPPF